MAHKPYQYKHLNPKRYIFISEGKRRITKVVEFIPLGIGKIMNLGFGDLLPDDSIDDKANSNNGDLVKVLATVIDILRHFTMQNPDAEIYFEGSTEERTVLYARILRNYYSTYSKEFAIAGVIADTKNTTNIIPFDPSSDRKFLAFVIKRIS
jgi:hypothetical protein